MDYLLTSPEYGNLRMIDQWKDDKGQWWGMFANEWGVFANLPFTRVWVR